MELHRTEQNEVEEVNIGFLQAGESDIELLEPTNSESGIGKYLAKNGAGLHHLCIEVEDIQATMNRLSEYNVILINETPKKREEGTLYCFIHPKSTGGVLVELYQLP